MNSLPDNRIQSISIQSHSIRPSPTPHTVYTIKVNTPTHSYAISHRYSDFIELLSHFTSECGSAPPGSLPGKKSGWGFGLGVSSWWNGGSGSHSGDGGGGGGVDGLSEIQIAERQLGLDRWLRGILSAKDSKWSTSKAFRHFLAAPKLDSQAQFTTASWLVEHSELIKIQRDFKATLTKRDGMVLRNDSQSHAVNAEVKKALVEFVRRIGGLTVALDQLAKEGMAHGELHRRGEMIRSLQDEAETIGKWVASVPRGKGGAQSSSGRGFLSSTQRETETGGLPRGTQQARTDLLSSKPTGRVLGAAAGATTTTSSSNQTKETFETRPLDNSGLLQLQQTYVAEQDSKLDTLTTALRRQRELGEMIGSELRVQSELLDHIEQDTDNVKGKLRNANQLAKKL